MYTVFSIIVSKILDLSPMVVYCKLLYFKVFIGEFLCIIYACKVDFVNMNKI